MPLTPDQIAAYHRDGFVTAHEVFAADAAALQAESDRLLTLTHLMESNNIRCRWQDHVETGECRFDCFDPSLTSVRCARASLVRLC